MLTILTSRKKQRRQAIHLTLFCVLFLPFVFYLYIILTLFLQDGASIQVIRLNKKRLFSSLFYLLLNSQDDNKKEINGIGKEDDRMIRQRKKKKKKRFIILIKKVKQHRFFCLVNDD